ncbi:MAG TPA: hypothetical protein VF713_07340 [Thermoanaerobaculia bacterium]
MIDKHSLLSSLDGRDPLTLELGCGPRKRYAGNAIDYGNVDIVAEALRAFPPASVDLITSSCYEIRFVLEKVGV